MERMKLQQNSTINERRWSANYDYNGMYVVYVVIEINC